MRNRKIIIFTQSKFTERDYNRFGVDYFTKNNFQVIIYDLTKILKSLNYINTYTQSDTYNNSQVKFVQSIEDLESKLVIEKDNSILFAMCWLSLFQKEIFLFQLLSKYKIQYCQFRLAILPDIRSWHIRILSKIYYNFKTHLIYNQINPANLILLAGRKANLQIGVKKCIKTKKINCGSFDYNIFLDNCLIENETNSFCYPEIVFIDQFWPTHPDFDGNEILNSEFYYLKVNAFLNKLEQQFNMTCAVALHPRNNSENNFIKYKGYKDQTHELIKHAKIVVAHHSTSLSFAVLYNKPIIHITFLKIKNTIEHKYIKRISKLLNTSIYFIDKNEDFKIKIPSVFENKYKDYIQNFLIDNSRDFTNDYKVEVLNYINSNIFTK